MGADQVVDRLQRGCAGPDLVGQGGQADLDAFLGIPLSLSVQGRVLPELLEEQRAIEGAIGSSPMASASRLGPAQPRGVGWKGAGGWLIFSQSRQVNFSRTVWITFHCRGMTSSVSVMSSPIFTMRPDPQQVQEAGASTTTRSRGK